MPQYLRLLAYRPFALLWLGATVSVLGDSLSWVALVWLVYEATGSPGKLGLLVVFYTAPVVVGGLLAGIALDHFNPRRVLLVDNVVRGTVMMTVPVLARLGALRLWHLYGVAGVYGAMKMISLAGVPTMIAGLLASDDLNTANALESISFSLGSIFGPVLSAFLIGRIGGANVLLIDAASYFVFAACLLGISRRRVRQSQSPQTATQLRPAVRFVLATPTIRAITLMFMAFNIGTGIGMVLLPVYTREILHQSVSTYGLLLSAMEVGGFIGSVAVGAVRTPRSLGRAIAGTQLACGVSFLGLLLRPAFPMALVLLGVAGFLSSPLTVWAQTIRMRLIPLALRGRVFALLRTLMQSAPPVGGALGGIVVASAGISYSVLIVATMIIGPGALGLIAQALSAAQTTDPVGLHEDG